LIEPNDSDSEGDYLMVNEENGEPIDSDGVACLRLRCHLALW
jgi:hypothetical protein